MWGKTFKNVLESPSLQKDNQNDHVSAFSLTTDGKFSATKLTPKSFLGYDYSDLTKLRFIDLCVPETSQSTSQLLARAMGGEIHSFECDMIHVSGSIHHLELLCVPSVYEPQAAEVHIFAKDITQQAIKGEPHHQRSAEGELFASEKNLGECLRLVLYQLCNKYPIISAGEAWVQSHFNQHVVLAASYSKSGFFYQVDGMDEFHKGIGLVGQAWSVGAPIYLPDLAASPLFKRKEFLATNGFKAGLAIPVKVRNRVIAIFTFFTSDQPAGELKLNEDHIFWQTLGNEINNKLDEDTQKYYWNFSLDLLCIGNAQSCHFYRMNQNFLELLDVDSQLVMPLSIKEFVHPDDVGELEKIKASIQSGLPISNVEFRVVAKNGKVSSLSLNVVPLPEKHIFLASGRDITHQRKLEKAIETEQKRFNQMVKDAPVAMCILHGKQHQFIHANAEYYKLTKRKPDIIGKIIKEVFPEFQEQGIIPLLDQVLEKGETFRTKEKRIWIQQGEKEAREMYLNFMYQPYHDEKGDVCGVFFFGVDVSQEVFSRKKIEESEKKFRAIFEQAAVGVAMIESRTGRIQRVNSKYCDIFGYTAEELQNMTFMELTIPEDLQGDLDNMSRLLRNEIREFAMEKRHFHKGGQVIWTHLTVSPMWSPGEEPHYHIAILKDITERKLAEQRIKESEKRYVDLIEQLPVAVYTCNLNGRIMLHNLAAETLWGKKPDYGDNVWCGSFEVLSPTGTKLSQGQSPMAIAVKEGRPVRGEEIIVKRPDGELRHVLPYPSPVINAEGLFTGGINVLIDITERKQAEEKIRTSKRMLAQSQQLAKVGGWEWDIKHNQNMWTDEMYRIFGLNPDTFIINMDSVLELIHPDDRHLMLKKVEQCVKDFQPYDFHYRFIRTDGATRTMHARGELIVDNDNQPVKMHGVAADVTDHIQAEQELTKLSLIAKKTINAVIITDQEGKVEWVNEAFVKITGYSLEEVKGKQYSELIYGPDTSDVTLTAIKEKMSNGESFEVEVLQYTKSGEPFWVNMQSQPVLNEQGELVNYFNIETDITETKKQQEEKYKLINALESSLNEIYLFDSKTLLFEYANHGALRNLKYTQEEIRQLTPPDIKPEYSHETFRELLRPLQAMEREIIEFETYHQRSDGSLYPVEVHLQYARNLEKPVFLAIILDISLRKLSEEKIRASEHLLAQSQKIAAIGGWEWNIESDKLVWTDELFHMFGIEPGSIKLNFESFFKAIHPEDKDHVKAAIDDAMHDHADFQFEYRIVPAAGIVRTLRTNGEVVVNKHGEVIIMRGVCADITGKLKTEEELLKLSLIARKTTNSVIITNPNGQIEWVNEAFCKLTGYQHKEVEGHKFSEMLYGELTDPATRAYIKSQIKKRLPFTCEIQEYDKWGKPFWVSIQGQPVLNEKGMLLNYFNIEVDITERKKAYEELILKENAIRNFAGHLNSVLEEERARISREIHDEFGQQLTGLKMSLSSVLRNAKETTMAPVLREMLSGVELTIKSLRKFANDLRPMILDSLGLPSAIEWLTKEVETKSKIKCHLQISVRQERIPEPVSLVFFRICQEALTNVMKHANPEEVWVKLEEKNDELRLEVIDNGSGMDVNAGNDPLSLGITSMRERAAIINANLTIESELEKGTFVLLVAQFVRQNESAV